MNSQKAGEVMVESTLRRGLDEEMATSRNAIRRVNRRRTVCSVNPRP